jgi:hypothetical protein
MIPDGDASVSKIRLRLIPCKHSAISNQQQAIPPGKAEKETVFIITICRKK